MSVKASLSLRLGQNLAMTPALQQAIRMLQLSSTDLQQEVAELLEQNFMLERDEATEASSADPAAAGDEAAVGTPDEAAPDDPYADTAADEAAGHDSNSPEPGNYESGSRGDAASATEAYEYRQASLTETPDLASHLAWQANLCTLDAEGRGLLAYLIDAVNDDGYLEDWPALQTRLTAEGAGNDAIERALTTLQSFEPAGVGARSVGECLLLQLDQAKDAAAPVCQLARRIVSRHLDLLARHEIDRLARELGSDATAVTAAVQRIRALSPHPGRAYAPASEQYVTPDVVASCVNGQWQVQINAEAMPRVRINREYSALVQRSARSQEQQTLRNHLQEARQLISALRARHDTLLRVARAIVERQRDFLEHGNEHMKPLVLREVAEALGIHESTVSRATAHKYLQTPRGIFELKYFFSSSIRTTQGGSASATAIQARLKRLIQSETPGKPLSDARLSELLRDEGVEVARRTVAKYREALGVPPAHQRRRHA